MNKQEQATAQNGLSVSGNVQTIATETKSLSGNFIPGVMKRNYQQYVSGTSQPDGFSGICSLIPNSFTGWNPSGYESYGPAVRATIDASHNHSVTFTPDVSISSNDNETRPVNYTIKIWKRVA